MANSLHNSRQLWINPVIVRDMRVRMRGTRAFWNQAIYLGLLSLIAILGYASSTRLTSDESFDPISVQQNLQQFYTWIFEGLALLITFVAPALTAVSILSEKKLQTLDLLVTTPMTSMQMLSGKLISSIAFIVLLLVLSVPASALCVILGGATISDVLQSYLLLTFDGVLMAAIGLSISCSAKQHIQAISGTYGAILLLLILTEGVGTALTTTVFGAISGHSSTPVPILSVLFELNPFFAAQFPSFSVSIFGLAIPVWIATGVVTVILVRLILTAAALRLGMYGEGLVASLRRQILVATLVATFIIGQATEQIGSFSKSTDAQIVLILLTSLLFLLALFFLPTLFVPVVDEDGAPGQYVEGSYDFRQAFGPRHSGGLPYFHLWLIVMIGGIVAGLLCPSGPRIAPIAGTITTASLLSTPIPWKPLMAAAGCVFFYLSGLGFLYWSIARRVAWLSSTSALARSLNFFLFALIALAPCAVMMILSQAYTDYDGFTQGWVRFYWILYPFEATVVDGEKLQWQSFLGYGIASYILGTLIYPFWWKVVPGASAGAWKRVKSAPEAA